MKKVDMSAGFLHQNPALEPHLQWCPIVNDGPEGEIGMSNLQTCQLFSYWSQRAKNLGEYTSIPYKEICKSDF